MSRRDRRAEARGHMILSHIEPMETKDILQAAIQAGKAIMEVYDSPQSEWQVESKADNSPLTLADRRSHEIISEALKKSPYLMISEEGKIRKYAERNHHRHVWIVDPLDGTKEFIKRNGEFTVNIALVEDGLPIFGVIYAPALHILYYGNARDGAFKCEVNPETGEWGEPQELPLARRKKGDKLRVVASRSHLSPETQAYIDRLKEAHGEVELVSAGSSLKICMVAEGSADVYPRLAPTMEWDTAAGQAIALAAGCQVVEAETEQPVRYNKEDLLNPFFIVKGSSLNIG